jgi:hypothetical protein
VTVAGLQAGFPIGGVIVLRAQLPRARIRLLEMVNVMPLTHD